MAELFNLRKARKLKARAEKEKKSAENRRLHGLTKAEKLAVRTRRERTERHLDGHRLEKPADDRDEDKFGNGNPSDR